MIPTVSESEVRRNGRMKPMTGSVARFESLFSHVINQEFEVRDAE